MIAMSLRQRSAIPDNTSPDPIMLSKRVTNLAERKNKVIKILSRKAISG
jgi:hypothetical protein